MAQRCRVQSHVEWAVMSDLEAAVVDVIGELLAEEDLPVPDLSGDGVLLATGLDRTMILLNSRAGKPLKTGDHDVGVEQQVVSD